MGHSKSLDSIFDALRDGAAQACLASGQVLRDHFGKKLSVEEKVDVDQRSAGLVTNVDLASEEAAFRTLKTVALPMDFLAEESGETQRAQGQADGRWILDPLDGTTNYVHGFPMFCVCIGAEWKGEMVAGAIYHPILNDLYLAVKGRGATLNGNPIHVSTRKNLSDALLTTGFTTKKNEWLHREMGAFERLSSIVRAVRRPGSAALDLAYTARGVFDGFWERDLNAWDVAAGSLIVQEAGGQVTDFKGGKFQVEGKEILASNGHLHASLQQTVAPDLCQWEGAEKGKPSTS